MKNPLRFAAWMLLLLNIALAIIASDPEILSHYLSGAMTVFFYLAGYLFDNHKGDDGFA